VEARVVGGVRGEDHCGEGGEGKDAQGLGVILSILQPHLKYPRPPANNIEFHIFSIQKLITKNL
jgi:hypothetical protein